MLLPEQAARRSSAPPTIQIFATDIDERALAVGARRRLSGGDRSRRVAGAAAPASSTREARAVPGRADAARDGAVRRAQPAARPAVLAPRPGLLPQPADLPRPRGAGGRARDVPLRAAAGRLPVPRLLRDGRRGRRPVRAVRQGARGSFAPHSRGRGRTARVPPVTIRESPIVAAPSAGRGARRRRARRIASSAAALQHRPRCSTLSAAERAARRPVSDVLHMSPGAAEFLGRSGGEPSDNLLASVATRHPRRTARRAFPGRADRRAPVVRASVSRGRGPAR